MTEAELREWLGVDETVPINPSIVEGMRSVDPPTNDASEIEAFKVFLGCAGKPAK